MSDTFLISRADLNPIFGGNPRVLQQFEELQRKVAEHEDSIGANVAATAAQADASYVTLSPNAELTNEFVFQVGNGLSLDAADGVVTLTMQAPVVTGGFNVQMTAQGDSTLVLPLTGVLATQQWVTAQGFSSGSAAWGSITGTLSAQTDLNSALSGKQATLVSGTNIKTVNGSSLLGSGDLSVTPGSVVLASHAFTGSESSWDSGTLPTGYSMLEIEIYGRTAKATALDDSKLTFNGDNAGTNYPYVRVSKAGSSSPTGTSSTGAAAMLVALQGSTVANVYGHFILKVPNHEDTNGYKVGSSEESYNDGTNFATRSGANWWKNTGAITSVQLASETGTNYAVGSRIVVRGFV